MPSDTPPAIGQPTGPAAPGDNNGPTKIADGKIPLFAKQGENYWALLNLILAVLALLITLIALVRKLLKRKDDDNQDRARTQAESDDDRRGRMAPVWMLIAAVLTIAGLILFMLTEDMRNPMALMDRWTIVHAILFIAVIVTLWLARRRKHESEEQSA